jgi:hypothetical protein
VYKKHGRDIIDAEFVDNDQEQFVTQFFNVMRKHLDIGISHVFVPQLNFDIGT